MHHKTIKKAGLAVSALAWILLFHSAHSFAEPEQHNHSTRHPYQEAVPVDQVDLIAKDTRSLPRDKIAEFDKQSLSIAKQTVEVRKGRLKIETGELRDYLEKHPEFREYHDTQINEENFDKKPDYLSKLNLESNDLETEIQDLKESASPVNSLAHSLIEDKRVLEETPLIPKSSQS